jgi:hypothetical protein
MQIQTDCTPSDFQIVQAPASSDEHAFSCCCTSISLLVGLVADGWCCFILREMYCWLVGDDWFVLREKYCWLVADKPNEQGAYRFRYEKILLHPRASCEFR